ncbi:uncharacterized protein N7511_010108 [Penicillium nucicola]|uniref:uncharacterized protein n=1 Tax=Penicillium nucicola TaxID=1850975 RepID=UPI0025454EF3|nr:uncharacterized protein N7511_010108 [Penicillium nucicola]KAJ5748412.1 hypothetical protein N7511_010108 [Penicillium nucicola]
MATKADAAPPPTEVPLEAFKLLPNNTDKNWIKDKGLRKLNLGILFTFSTACSSGYIASLVNSLLVLPQFDMIIGGLNPNIVGLIIAGTSLGAFLAFVPASYIADRYGRKVCVGIGCCLVIVATIIQTILKDHWAFFGMRVLSGMGMGISQTAAPLLITEVAHPRQRQTATAFYNATWCLGAIGAAAVTYLTISLESSWSWRIPCLMQVTYPISQLFGLVFFIPESPRWLISKGQKEEALVILAKYHANGKMDDELVHHEFCQICDIIDAEAAQRRSWKAFFSSKGDVHRLSICVLVGLMQEWAGNGILSYYLAPTLASVGITKSSDQAAVNVSLQVWNFLLSAVGSMASERYGRRVLWLLSTAGMLLFLSLATLVAGLFAEQHLAAAGIAVVPLLFIFFAFYDMAYAPLFISYPAEILPFRLRAKGLAVTLSVDAAACFFNQYVNPVAFTALQWKYYSVYIGCLVVFLGLVYLLFPETKGRSLEEVAMIFETEEEHPDSAKSADVK